MAGIHTTVSPKNTRTTRKLNVKSEAIQRIKVSHMYRAKIYGGAKNDIVAAGLASAEQCPSEQGDSDAIEYKMDGKLVHCSLQNCGRGSEYWITVDDPQPQTCKRILKALGDPVALDEILSDHLCALYALQDFVQNYGKHATSNETNSQLLRLVFAKFKGMAAKARKLYLANPEYQDEMFQAAESIDRLFILTESMGDEITDADMRILLREHVTKMCEHVSKAAEYVKYSEGRNWEWEKDRAA
ncbi:MAG: hypothetical protein ACTS5Y_06705 [Pollutimonas bauzanensis]